jgi:hypothetical protein
MTADLHLATELRAARRAPERTSPTNRLPPSPEIECASRK